VEFLEKLILDEEDPLHMLYIHRRIWETGNPNFAACNANLVARTAWLLFQRQISGQTQLLEYLGYLLHVMELHAKTMEEIDGVVQIVDRCVKRAYMIPTG